MSAEDPQAFEDLAQTDSPGLLRELRDFLLHSKKWWLVPIVVLLLLMGLLVFLSGTGAAPLTYPFY